MGSNKKYGKKAFENIKETKDQFDDLKMDTIRQARFQDLGGLSFLHDKDTDNYILKNAVI